MMSLISLRHGVHHEAQQYRNTGWPLKADRLRVSPANVLRVKSGALEPGAWDESTAAAVVSAAHAIDVGREQALTSVPKKKRRASISGARRSCPGVSRNRARSSLQPGIEPVKSGTFTGSPGTATTAPSAREEGDK